MNRLTRLFLLAGDLLALLAFVYIGQREHAVVDAANPVFGVLLTTGYFALPWVVAGCSARSPAIGATTRVAPMVLVCCSRAR